MFELATLSSAVLIGALFGTLVLAALLLALLRNPRGRRRHTRKDRGDSIPCSMCQRPTPSAVLHGWTIRTVEQLICERCHPFYKMRFAAGDLHPATEAANAPVERPELVGPSRDITAVSN